MRELQLKEIQNIELKILIELDRFCRKNNLKYYLCGGTLLGAIRHRGFIPWDDDIDVMMPRENFEIFINKFNHEFYKVKYINTCNKYIEKSCKLVDTRTLLKSNHLRKKTIEENIFIDVFPIDGLPENKYLQKIHVLLVQVIIAIHSSTVLSYSISKRYNDKNSGVFYWKKYFRTFIKFLMITTIGITNTRFWIIILNKILKRYNFDNSLWVAALTSGIYGEREIMPKKIFCRSEIVKFERYKFFAPIGYDYYLKRLYGDYMKLPPVEFRQSHHNFKAYWKENIFMGCDVFEKYKRESNEGSS